MARKSSDKCLVAYFYKVDDWSPKTANHSDWSPKQGWSQKLNRGEPYQVL
jgi:hypothetical protein